MITPLLSKLISPLINPLINKEDEGDLTPSLLLENGFFLLLEDGTQLYLE